MSMHCPNCATPLTLVGLHLDGRVGQYAARFLCAPCTGEDVTAVDADTTYHVHYARPAQAFTIADDAVAEGVA